MKSITAIIGIWIFFLCILQSHVKAADIILGPSNNIHIIGEIKKGDFDKFNKVLNESKNNSLLINSICPASPGGDIIEAMRIGRLIRDSFIQTGAPGAPIDNEGEARCFWHFIKVKETYSCTCTSACFIIWAAGVERFGDYLGIHRPYFSKEHFDGLSASEAEKKYSMMSKQVKEYLLEMGIPQNVIQKMFETASDEILFLDSKTIESMKSVPFFDEWIKASCEPLTDEESHDSWQLFYKEYEGKKLSNAEKVYKKYLDEKQGKFNKCHSDKMRKAQFEGMKN